MESFTSENVAPELNRHLGTIIYKRRARDLFRKSFWAVCWRGDREAGPFPKGLAKLAAIQIEAEPCTKPKAVFE